MEQPGPVQPAAFVRAVLAALADVVAVALHLLDSHAGDGDLPAAIDHDRD